ncbi:MAG TPA: hypothetical protein DCM08_03830 [Microscillaceae bacterium]|nr:hypothetical protein [Microscillaceae bacterium]
MIQTKVEKLHNLTGHKDCVYTLAQGATPSQIFSAAGDGMVVKWDLEKPEIGKVVVQVQKSVYALHYLPKNNHLLVGQNFEGLYRVDLDHNTVINSLYLGNRPIFDIKPINDIQILLAMGDGELLLMDLESWKVLQVFKLSEKSVRAIALHPLGQLAAIACSDGYVHVLDLATLEIVHSFVAHQNAVFAVVFSPNGQWLLSGGRDARLNIWQVEQHFEQLQSIVAHLYTLNHIVFSPSGRFFVTASMDKSIKLFQTEGFQLLKVIDKARHAGHGTSINKLLWTNYFGQLVSASDDRLLAVWDIQFSD